MSSSSDELLNRATRYANARKIVLEGSLGFGKDGTVFMATTSHVAVKVYQSQQAYETERDVYMRLAEHGVTKILGHAMPQMIAWSNKLLIIEMTVVRPPYILDFASARLDHPPDFPPEVLEQWEQDRFEEFGPHWSRVKTIMQIMQDQYGIYLTDVHPRNIAFE